MRAAGVQQAAIDTFTHYYRQLERGETGLLPESEIEPVDATCRGSPTSPIRPTAAALRSTRP